MIDREIVQPWPLAAIAATATFAQGDLVERPAFAFAVGEEPIWGASARGDDFQDRLLELHQDDGPPFGVITTQTCDLAEQGSPTQPWFMASPVYAVPEDEDAQKRLLSKAYTYELAPESLAGRWVADLRIELPIEKSFLIGSTPRAGFVDPKDAERFGAFLGRRRARPAFANELADEVIRKIDRRRSNNKNKAKPVWAELYGIRLEVATGHNLRPVTVRLHVICKSAPTDAVKDWFAEWELAVDSGAKASGITVMGTQFHDATKMPLASYDASIDLGLV